MFERDSLVFLGLVVSSALWAVVHLSLALRALGHAPLSWQLRVLAFVPPVTPVVGFMVGAPARSVLWMLFAATYLVLRTAA
jgi:hypothetical protein